MNESTEPHARQEPGPVTGGERPALWTSLLAIGLLGLGSLLTAFLYRGTPAPTGPAAEPDLAHAARDDLQRRQFQPLSGPLEALIADPAYQPIPTQTHPLLLQPAPDFTLADVGGKPWSLAPALRDGPVVLVFYYGYHCNHCVSQLFALDKDIARFRELGVTVVAVSADPPELTRARFEQYGAFAFPVLSDPGNKVAEKYSTFTPNPVAGEEGDLLHGTFLISRPGVIVWANRGEGPFTENRTLLCEAARLENRFPPAARPGTDGPAPVR